MSGDRSMTSEQRIDVRKRTFLKGRIEFNGGASTMDCLVRDLSATGARLELSETSALPEVFDLYIAQKDTTYRSTLCWRRDDGIGVTFGEPKTVEPPPPAPDGAMTVLLRRLHELEAENAALRSILAKMGEAAAA